MTDRKIIKNKLGQIISISELTGFNNLIKAGSNQALEWIENYKKTGIIDLDWEAHLHNAVYSGNVEIVKAIIFNNKNIYQNFLDLFFQYFHFQLLTFCKHY